MKSKIINMVDKLKDSEDKLLESLFGSDPILDSGFSARVMTRLNRRLWVRRLTLPAAVVIGAAVAVKPLSQLVMTFSKLLTLIPVDVGGVSMDAIPQMTTVLLGGLLLGAMMMITRILED